MHEKIIIFSVFPIISFNFLRFRKTTMQNRGIWLTFKCLEMDKHLKIILSSRIIQKQAHGPLSRFADTAVHFPPPRLR